MVGTYTGSRGELNFEDDVVELLTDIKNGWSKDVIKNPTPEELAHNLRQIITDNNISKLAGIPLTNAEFGQILEHISLSCMTPVAANVFLNGKRVSIVSEINRGIHQAGEEIYLDVFNPIEVAGGKSRYQVVEQPVFRTSGQYNNRRGDLLLLINGLPVIQIELKAAGKKLEEGINQIRKYMNEGVYTGLFSMIQVFFVMTPEDAVYFANSCPQLNPAFMFHWADRENKIVHDWKQLISGPDRILSIPEAHRLIGYYTTANIKKDSNGCIENLTGGTLMVARSYQIYAIRAILKRVKKHEWGTQDPLGGYIWGTTGCGKTLTSYKTGQLIIDMNYADKVIFVVDRKELSEQSFEEYNAFARNGEPVRGTENTHKLFQILLNEKDRLVITSIQKLSRINEEKAQYIDAEDLAKINRKRIVFLVDEAHRSQFGKMHERIKNSFTNAVFFGFTGTPVFSDNDKAGMTSKAVFGDCLAVYSIASGIRDRNVLGFAPTMVKTFEDQDLKDAIARDKAKIKSLEEAKQKGNEKKLKIWQEVQQMDMTQIEKLLPKEQYLTDEHQKAVVKDILTHWDNLCGGKIRFHALLATESITEAIEYYRLFKYAGKKLKVTALFDPDMNQNSAAVIQKESGLVEIIDDYNRMFQMAISRDADPSLKVFKSDVAARLAHKGAYQTMRPEDMLDIVIVVDQLLTGFDSKYINTLYLDKVLDTDNLIQAISRTNRVINAGEKPFGIFRYYRMPYTMNNNIHEALKLYCEGSEDSGAIVSSIEENLVTANKLFDGIFAIFANNGIHDFRRCPASDADRQQFRLLFQNLRQTCKAMKLQGMDWEKDDDEYAQQLKCHQKWIDGETRLLDILQERYNDLLPAHMEPQIRSGSVGYDLTADLSEVEREKIDADYLEEHFNIAVSRVESAADDDEKDAIVNEFVKYFAKLSAEQQTYAEAVIRDVRNGVLDAAGKSLKELIAEYRTKAQNEKVSRFAGTYGLDAHAMLDLYLSGEDDLKISRLLDTCDKDLVCLAFGCKWWLARGKLNQEIRNFLTS